MLADYHIHSEFSDDSSEPMRRIVMQALALGLDEICFTDHVDYGVKFDRGARGRPGAVYNVDYPRYFGQIAGLRQEFGDKITIRTGLEFGVQRHTLPAFQQLFDSCELDFVILSCHQVDDQEFWTRKFQRGKTPKEYNARYYAEIYDCIRVYKDYSVLGHLDVIQRYGDSIYPFSASREIIEKILTQVIADNRGIEVNTSSFRYGLPDLMPERAILRLYRELGGRIVTIGSDSHRAKDTGDRIALVQSELKALGFSSFCTFERMRPIFHELA